MYFSAHYNEQGKLVEVSSPQPVKFAGKGDDAIGYIEKDGKIYTLPVTKGKYQMMQQEVQKNQGQSINLASTLESNIEPELAKTQDVYNFKQQENIRTKEQDKDNPLLPQENSKQNQPESRNISNEVSLSNEGADVRQDLGIKKEKSNDEKIAHLFGKEGLKQYKDKLNQSERRDSILSEPVLEKEVILQDSIKMHSGSDDFDKVINVDSTRINASLSEAFLKKEGLETIKEVDEALEGDKISIEEQELERRNANVAEPSDQIDSTENIENVEMTDDQIEIERKKIEQEVNLEYDAMSIKDKMNHYTELLESLEMDPELAKELKETEYQSLLQEDKNKNVQEVVSVEGSKQNEFKPRSNAVLLSNKGADVRQELGIKKEQNTGKELPPKAKENNVNNPFAHTAEEIKQIQEKVLKLKDNPRCVDPHGNLNSKGRDQRTLIENKKKIDVESNKIMEGLKNNPTYKNNKALLDNKFKNDVSSFKNQIISDKKRQRKDDFIKGVKKLTEDVKKSTEVLKKVVVQNNAANAAYKVNGADATKIRENLENSSKNSNANPNTPLLKNNSQKNQQGPGGPGGR